MPRTESEVARSLPPSHRPRSREEGDKPPFEASLNGPSTELTHEIPYQASRLGMGSHHPLLRAMRSSTPWYGLVIPRQVSSAGPSRPASAPDAHRPGAPRAAAPSTESCDSDAPARGPGDSDDSEAGDQEITSQTKTFPATCGGKQVSTCHTPTPSMRRHPHLGQGWQHWQGRAGYRRACSSDCRSRWATEGRWKGALGRVTKGGEPCPTSPGPVGQSHRSA